MGIDISSTYLVGKDRTIHVTLNESFLEAAFYAMELQLAWVTDGRLQALSRQLLWKWT